MPPPITITGDHTAVTDHTQKTDVVSLTLGEGPDAITFIGSRYEVHRMILEADRQLGRLVYRTGFQDR